MDIAKEVCVFIIDLEVRNISNESNLTEASILCANLDLQSAQLGLIQSLMSFYQHQPNKLCAKYEGWSMFAQLPMREGDYKYTEINSDKCSLVMNFMVYLYEQFIKHKQCILISHNLIFDTSQIAYFLWKSYYQGIISKEVLDTQIGHLLAIIKSPNTRTVCSLYQFKKLVSSQTQQPKYKDRSLDALYSLRLGEEEKDFAPHTARGDVHRLFLVLDRDRDVLQHLVVDDRFDDFDPADSWIFNKKVPVNIALDILSNLIPADLDDIAIDFAVINNQNSQSMSLNIECTYEHIIQKIQNKPAYIKNLDKILLNIYPQHTPKDAYGDITLQAGFHSRLMYLRKILQDRHNNKTFNKKHMYYPQCKQTPLDIKSAYEGCILQLGKNIQ